MLNPLRIIACDDERPALKNLEQCFQKASPEAILSCFRYPEDVLKFAKDNKIDVAFLDISMSGKKGTELAVFEKGEDVFRERNTRLFGSLAYI